MDDGRLGMIIEKSATANRGATDGPRGTTYCSITGGTLGAVGALLRTALGLVEGGTFNAGRLFGGTALVVVLGSELVAPDKPDPVEPLVICASSSWITMGWSASAIVGSEEAAGPEVGRRRSMGDALKILPNQWRLVSISSSRKDEIILLR